MMSYEFEVGIKSHLEYTSVCRHGHLIKQSTLISNIQLLHISVTALKATTMSQTALQFHDC